MSQAASHKRALQRSKAYQAQFNLPADELLIDEFNCALQQKILLQGKLYISQNFACFHANIFGQETVKILLASDITGVQLAKILFIPNSIKVFLTYETYFFASFLHRDDAYKLLTRMSRGESISNMGIWARPDEEAAEGDEGEGSGASDSDESAASRPRKGGHGRSGSMSKSPGPRSPTTGGSVVRHASLLSDHAFKVRSENDKKRADTLRETQRALKDASLDDERSRSSRTSRTDARSDDEEDAPPPPKKGSKASAAAAASSKKPRKPASDEDDEPTPPPRNGKSKGAKQRKVSSEEEEEEPEEPRKKAKQPSAAWLAAASHDTFLNRESPAAARRAAWYASALLPASGIEPAIATLLTQFKDKKIGLDDATCRRRLHFQGPLQRQGGWSVVDRWGFLFSDQFLFAEYDPKSKTPVYKSKQRIPLLSLMVDMRPSGFQSLGSTKLSGAWRLLDNSPEPAQYVVATATADERIEWGRKLCEAISRAHVLAGSKVDRTLPGWYTQFVRGTLPYAIIYAEDDLLAQLLRTAQKEHINDLDQEGNGLLHLCVLNCTPQILPVLVAAGADLALQDWDGYTALHRAVATGHMASVTALLGAKGMDPTVWHPVAAPRGGRILRDKSALWLAALSWCSGNAVKMELLLRALVSSTGAAAKEFLDERSEGNDMTLLDYCAHNPSPGLPEVARVILSLGAAVDLQNLDNLTPLSQACKAGNVAMVQLLLRHGAQPNARTASGAPLWHCGKGGAALECARELVSAGARYSDPMRERGLRARDLFPSSAAEKILRLAEEARSACGPIESSEGMRPPASSAAGNNRRSFDCCALCAAEFSLVNKREYCRRCGWNVCGACTARRMSFVSSSKASKRPAPAKERVCDGCWNFVSWASLNPTRVPVLSPKSAGSGIEAAEFRKAPAGARKPPPAESDDSDGSGVARGARRPEPSGFKSIKRLNVDSDSEEDASDDEPPANRKTKGTAPAKKPSHAEEESSEPEAKPAGLGGFMSRTFSKGPPPKGKAAATCKESEDDSEEDERAAARARQQAKAAKGAMVAAGVGTAATNGRKPAAASSARASAAAADSDEDSTPLPRGAGRPPGWSKNAAPPSSDEDDGDATDSDADDGRKEKEGKKNIFQRGFLSATSAVKSAGGAVKSAGGAVGGAMGGALSSVKSGVTKLAHTVQEKVTAVSVPVDEDGEDSDPAVAAKARRKEAARQRVRARRAQDAAGDEGDDLEDAVPASASGKAAGTAAKMGDAKKQALRNQELLDQMARKGDEVEDGGREFQSLASKLKAKSKAGRM